VLALPEALQRGLVDPLGEIEDFAGELPHAGGERLVLLDGYDVYRHGHAGHDPDDGAVERHLVDVPEAAAVGLEPLQAVAGLEVDQPGLRREPVHPDLTRHTAVFRPNHTLRLSAGEQFGCRGVEVYAPLEVQDEGIVLAGHHFAVLSRQPVGVSLGDGEIKEGGLVEESAKNQLDTYGKRFCLTRKMIINDDLGAFMKVPTAMGNRAARLIDQLFFARLLKNPVQADGKALFSNPHRNLLSGASSALSADSLKKAVQLFLDQVDADGQPISVEPKFLLVPTALKHLAIELTKGATLIMGGGAEQTIRPALNVLADENLTVVSSPYLGNSAYEGASQSGWYLFGDPRTVDTWEIGFLKGKRTPTVERGETDFNTLGLWFRVYFDLGVREQDHRGMVKATGAAN